MNLAHIDPQIRDNPPPGRRICADKPITPMCIACDGMTSNT